ncbi:hypothetical protein BCR37DRAFT_385004 [Protomyces lactucae-debilis]|uniref:DUF5672 domain-containing protein n=1 Tax=Protomyces lactucae-debilis TaxID=2754530 RepID=A0A1Y2FUL5_PROLT|nr:uncharacterized protein BCR37DRAFT_385004 [Protomyces lactucae-debilis]ORY87703.1 hypothetical protein BCR37DRAFT_385004 [Protomyces lactucae-debilis]
MVSALGYRLAMTAFLLVILFSLFHLRTRQQGNVIGDIQESTGTSGLLRNAVSGLTSSPRKKPGTDCLAMMRQKYGLNRFTRVAWQDDTRNVNFPEGFPVADAHQCMPTLSTKKVAVLVEMRPQPNWVYHVIHFIHTLDDDWPFVIYHSRHNELLLRDDPALQPHILSGKVQLHRLNTVFPTSESISQLLTHAPLYEALAPADHILLYQIDSTLCAASPLKVEDFFKYDFVGAPITHNDDETPIFNGGFTVRNRNAMLHVIKNERPFDHPDNEEKYEDRWYSMTMAKSNHSYKLPTAKEAEPFAVESRFHPLPVGVHRPRVYLPQFAGAERVEELLRNCPEGDRMPDKSGGHFDPCLNDPNSKDCVKSSK